MTRKFILRSKNCCFLETYTYRQQSTAFLGELMAVSVCVFHKQKKKKERTVTIENCLLRPVDRTRNGPIVVFSAVAAFRCSGECYPEVLICSELCFQRTDAAECTSIRSYYTLFKTKMI